MVHTVQSIHLIDWLSWIIGTFDLTSKMIKHSCIRVLWGNNSFKWTLQISLTGSCYTTIAITTERFLAVRMPFFIHKHNVKARMFIIPVFVYAVIYNISRFFELEVVYLSCQQFINGTFTSKEFNDAMNITCSHPYAIQHTNLRKSSLYISVSWFQLFCNSFR